MTSLPSENETYLVSPACGGDVEAVRPRQRGHEKRAGLPRCALLPVTSPSDAAYGRASLGCGALFLLRGTQPACKKQTAAPAPLRLFLPQAAPQLRSPARVRAYKEWIRMLLL